VFHATYYDVRDATTAFATLDGQVVFGVKLRLFDHADPGLEPLAKNSSDDGSPATKNSIPFPTSDPVDTHQEEDPEPIKHEERRTSPDKSLEPGDDVPDRVRPRSVSAGHTDNSPTASSALQTPSTGTFSHGLGFPPSVSCATQQTHDIHGRRHSNQLFFDAVGKTTTANIRDQMNKGERKTLSLDVDLDATATGEVAGEVADEDGWMGLDDSDVRPRSPRHNVHSYTVQPQYYFPAPPSSAVGPDLRGTTPPYYNVNPLPTVMPPPTPYYTSQPAPQPPAIHFPLPPPSSPIGFLGYEYDPQFHTNTANVNWAFEHSMMMAAANANANANTLHPLAMAPPPLPLPPPSRVDPGVGQEYWYQNGLGHASLGGMYYPNHQIPQPPPPPPPPPPSTVPQYTLMNPNKPHVLHPLQDSYIHQTEHSPYFSYPASPVVTVPSSSSSLPYNHHSNNNRRPLHASSPSLAACERKQRDSSLPRSVPSSSHDLAVAATVAAAGAVINGSGSTSTSNGANVPAERNQLNWARIEDGQDTRTTVMIKNIPNKMSDRDLMAYIGKVCPRKIDFLYLRMDFQNGKCVSFFALFCVLNVNRMQRWICVREFHFRAGLAGVCKGTVGGQVVSTLLLIGFDLQTK
jgi:hypothetical protein